MLCPPAFARRSLAGLLTAAALLAADSPARAGYTVTDLGSLGGGSTIVTGISNGGHVVGHSNTAFNQQFAFLWQNGVMTNLGALPFGRGSGATAVNSVGQVVGWSDLGAGAAGPGAFQWQDGVMSGIYVRQNVFPTGINTAGQVTGWSSDHRGNAAAFVWQAGASAEFSPPDGGTSLPNGINDAGQVVGSWYLANSTNSHGFLWQNGVMTSLGTLPGGSSSRATAVNAGGHVVGWSGTFRGESHAFLWQDGVMTDLGHLGTGESVALAINRAGHVVGYSYIPDGHQRAFLWRNGVMTDLNDLMPAGFGFVLREARGINDAGQIVAFGTTDNGSMSGSFILTPTAAVPEPAGVVTLAVGAAGLAVARRRGRAA